MKYKLNHIDIREAVSKLCLKFDGKYWQNCDRNNSYPEEFVQALTDAGYLSSLIPEEYGGLGLSLSVGASILEEIHKSGSNAAACHAQMYTMGTLLRHGSDEQKKEYLPKIANGSTRLQAFGVTEPTSGSDTTSLKCSAVLKDDIYYVNGQKVWTSRAEHSDLILLLIKIASSAFKSGPTVLLMSCSSLKIKSFNTSWYITL